MKTSSIKTCRFIHTWSSLVATVFLLILCITGLPLIFHEEIEHWQEPHAELDIVPNDHAPPTVDALVEQARAGAPGGQVRFIVFDREHPVLTVGLAVPAQKPGRQPAMQSSNFNTFTGAAAEPDEHESGFMDIMLRFHTDLYAGQAGLYFMGAMGVLLAIAIVSGVLLYSPFMRKLPFGSVRTGKAQRLYWLDLHNLLGIATPVWILVVALTGTINTLEQPIGALWRATDLAAILERHRNTPPPVSLPSIDAVIASAEHAAPGMKAISLLFPGQELAGPGHFLVVLSGTEALTERLFQTALIDGQTGRLTELSDMPWYVKTLFLSQPLHFGDYAGLPLKIIWALLDLATIAILVSGLYLWIARRKHRNHSSDA